MASVIAFRSSRHSAAETRFRCTSCRVAFTPTRGHIDLCPKCEAGNDLYHSILAYQRASQGSA